MNNLKPASDLDWDKITDEFGRVTDPDLRLLFKQTRAVQPIEINLEHPGSVWCREDTGEGPCYDEYQITDLYIKEPQSDLAALIPECVPDGAYLFDDKHSWKWDTVKPDWENEKWCGSCTQRFIPEWLAPELYAAEIPIEQACIQVQRETESTFNLILRLVEDLPDNEMPCLIDCLSEMLPDDPDDSPADSCPLGPDELVDVGIKEPEKHSQAYETCRDALGLSHEAFQRSCGTLADSLDAISDAKEPEQAISEKREAVKLRLKEFIRQNQSDETRCRILSMGDDCCCPLCDVDRLLERTNETH